MSGTGKIDNIGKKIYSGVGAAVAMGDEFGTKAGLLWIL